jgi:hypothetical protein
MEPLLKMATDQFGELTAAAVKLLESVNDGRPADCGIPPNRRTVRLQVSRTHGLPFRFSLTTRKERVHTEESH